MTGSERLDLVVVGLGAVGAACLYQAARRGARVLGLDRFVPPHDRGSSHGETRITRLGVGEGAAYVPLALRSHAIWDALEAETGARLIDRCGFLLLARDDAGSLMHGKSGFLARTVAAAQAFGIDHARLDAAAIAARFPQFTGLVGDEEGYFEPGGGQLFPERCIDVQLAEARRLGALVRTGQEVLGVEPDGEGVRILTAEGALLAARAVVAAGTWMPRLALGIGARLTVHRQTLHWFALEDDRAWAGEAPVWIRIHGPGVDGQFYGFPPLGQARAVKCAGEQYADDADPDRLERQVAPEESAALFARHLRGRLAGVSARVVKAAACAYTVAPDGDFLVRRHPESGAILLVSACSGHGFKHSAALGEALAGAALEGAAPLLAPFGLD